METITGGLFAPDVINANFGKTGLSAAPMTGITATRGDWPTKTKNRCCERCARA
jgi:hypothetical protein